MRFLRQSGCVCDRDVAECEYLCKWSVELRNMLASLPTVRASDAEFDHELTRLKTSFRDLFEWEELLMIRTRYADYAPHRRLHEAGDAARSRHSACGSSEAPPIRTDRETTSSASSAHDRIPHRSRGRSARTQACSEARRSICTGIRIRRRPDRRRSRFDVKSAWLPLPLFSNGPPPSRFAVRYHSMREGSFQARSGNASRFSSAASGFSRARLPWRTRRDGARRIGKRSMECRGPPAAAPSRRTSHRARSQHAEKPHARAEVPKRLFSFFPIRRVAIPGVHAIVRLIHAPVAHLDRATASGAVGSGFKSRRAHHFSS